MVSDPKRFLFVAGMKRCRDFIHFICVHRFHRWFQALFGPPSEAFRPSELHERHGLDKRPDANHPVFVSFAPAPPCPCPSPVASAGFRRAFGHVLSWPWSSSASQPTGRWRGTAACSIGRACRKDLRTRPRCLRSESVATLTIQGPRCGTAWRQRPSALRPCRSKHSRPLTSARRGRVGRAASSSRRRLPPHTTALRATCVSNRPTRRTPARSFPTPPACSSRPSKIYRNPHPCPFDLAQSLREIRFGAERRPRNWRTVDGASDGHRGTHRGLAPPIQRQRLFPGAGATELQSWGREHCSRPRDWVTRAHGVILEGWRIAPPNLITVFAAHDPNGPIRETMSWFAVYADTPGFSVGQVFDKIGAARLAGRRGLHARVRSGKAPARRQADPNLRGARIRSIDSKSWKPLPPNAGDKAFTAEARSRRKDNKMVKEPD